MDGVRGGGMKKGQACWIAAGQTALNPDKYKQISMPTVTFFQVFPAPHKYHFPFDQSFFWRPRGKDGTRLPAALTPFYLTETHCWLGEGHLAEEPTHLCSWNVLAAVLLLSREEWLPLLSVKINRFLCLQSLFPAPPTHPCSGRTLVALPLL